MRPLYFSKTQENFKQTFLEKQMNRAINKKLLIINI